MLQTICKRSLYICTCIIQVYKVKYCMCSLTPKLNGSCSVAQWSNYDTQPAIANISK